MEIISHDYADELHESQLHPYSQYLERDPDGYLNWVINCTNQKACNNILAVLLQKDCVELKKLNKVVKFEDKIYKEIGYETLVNSFYQEKYSKYLDVRIKSPLSFKRDGEYYFFPDIRAIYKSLMNKYDSAMKDSDNCIFDLSTLDELCEKTKIIRYNIKSCGFPLEGVVVSSFWGTLSLKISAPQTLINFAHMLFKFGEYSGVGIKTSMGMGAIGIVNNNGGVKNEYD